MLVSQAVAESLDNFLHVPMITKTELNQLRIRIMGAKKIIVPENFMNLSTQVIGEISPLIEVFAKEDAARDKRMELQHEYASKLPFSSVFIENSSGGILLEEDPHEENAFIMHVVYSDSRNEYMKLIAGHSKLLKNYHVPKKNMVVSALIELRFVKGTTGDSSGEMVYRKIYGDYTKHPELAGTLEQLEERASILLVAAREILLYLNVSNVASVKYTPSKKELGMVPKNFQSLYEYHILDIYREEKQYTSISDIERGFREAASLRNEHRAHMVRGHFKRKKNGLFWWNPFMRCRSNRDTVGLIEKDYRLKIK